jgi:hypothetical protein
MEIYACWNITPCRLVDNYQSVKFPLFSGSSDLLLDPEDEGTALLNACNCLPVDKAYRAEDWDRN